MRVILYTIGFLEQYYNKNTQLMREAIFAMWLHISVTIVRKVNWIRYNEEASEPSRLPNLSDSRESFAHTCMTFNLFRPNQLF